jgi:hypothetical protein
VSQDLNRIWENAVLYNGSVHAVGKTAAVLRKIANDELRRVGFLSAGGAAPLATVLVHAC